MPIDLKKYPPEWKAISLARRQLAGGKCEWCRAPHGEVVTRAPGFWSIEPDWGYQEVWRDCAGVKHDTESVARQLGVSVVDGPEGHWLPDCRVWTAKVVLTCAHTDLDGGDRHDKYNLRGLRALCQSCHLAYDLQDHIAHARQTRLSRKAAGSLFEVLA